MDIFTLDLPFPVSTNVYWRFIPGQKRPLISREGREFAAEVAKRVQLYPHRGKFPLEGRLAVYLDVLMPDHRRRDLDNTLKSSLDALCKAGVFLDDSQIDELRARRIVERGKRAARVSIWRIDDPT